MLPTGTLQSIERATRIASRILADGCLYADISLDLPDGGSVSLRILRSSRNSSPALKLNGGSHTCSACKMQIEGLRDGYGVHGNLSRLIHKAVVVILKCISRDRESLSDVQTSNNGSRTPEEQRIRVISTTKNFGRSASVPQKLLTLATVSEKTTTLGKEDHSPDRFSEASGEAPELSYALASGVLVHVVFPMSLRQQIMSHCADSRHTGKEVGGVLVGYCDEIRKTPSGCLAYSIIVSDIIPMMSQDSSMAHLRLNEDSWLDVERQFTMKFSPEHKFRLGWYHTHPTQGIFFSGQDIDAHTVFTRPFQFAIVVDPRTMEAGLFFWLDYAGRHISGPVRFHLDYKGLSSTSTASTRPIRNVFTWVLTWIQLLLLLASSIAFWRMTEWNPSFPYLTTEHVAFLLLLFLLAFQLCRYGVLIPKSERYDLTSPNHRLGQSWSKRMKVLFAWALALTPLLIAGPWILSKTRSLTRPETSRRSISTASRYVDVKIEPRSSARPMARITFNCAGLDLQYKVSNCSLPTSDFRKCALDFDHATERQWLRSVFGWSTAATDADSILHFQNQLGIPKELGDQGHYDDYTRFMFLNRVVEAQNTSKGLWIARPHNGWVVLKVRAKNDSTLR